MLANQNLTREQAVRLIRGEAVICPNCARETLLPRYAYKKQNVEYQCPACKAIYRPCKLI
jgi:predicted RNA-binding Zn-ribbon protein involved in translation (DUF1610 family)